MPPSVFIIAEAGDNHDGHLEQALRLVDAAARAGADAVKFQTFHSEELLSDRAPMAEYQVANTGKSESQLDMVRSLELPDSAWDVIAERCRERGIEFMSTPYDPASLETLLRVGVRRIKISSGELTNAPLLLAIGAARLPVILSTGMATLPEIEEALGVLAFGMLQNDAGPSRAAFRKAGQSDEGRRLLETNVTLLHCTTEYPAPLDEVNLRAMDTLRERFGLPTGYSDHTRGLLVPVAAAARGAVAVEKHFTLDHDLPGPDHKASLEPDELAEMVRQIRAVERCLGNGRKEPTASERKNAPLVRRGLVALRPLRKGERFRPGDLGPKRPEAGASPMDYYDILGTVISRDYAPDEPVEG